MLPTAPFPPARCSFNLTARAAHFLNPRTMYGVAPLTATVPFTKRQPLAKRLGESCQGIVQD